MYYFSHKICAFLLIQSVAVKSERESEHEVRPLWRRVTQLCKHTTDGIVMIT